MLKIYYSLGFHVFVQWVTCLANFKTVYFIKIKHNVNEKPLVNYLFGVLRLFQHCTGHITMGSFVGRGNQYIQLVKFLYCKLSTVGKQLPTFPHKVEGKKGPVIRTRLEI